jgi:hypothetical protein
MLVSRAYRYAEPLDPKRRGSYEMTKANRSTTVVATVATAP